MGQEFPFKHFFQSPPVHSPVSKSESSDFISFPLDFPPKQEKREQSFSLEKEELKKINGEILHYLKQDISPQKFNVFFEKSFFLSDISSKQVKFSTTTFFISNTVKKDYFNEIKNAVHSILGKSYEIIIGPIPQKSSKSDTDTKKVKKHYSAKDVSFTLDLTPTQGDLLSQVESKYIAHMNPDEKGILIDSSKTFDSFVVGPSNTFAHATTQSVAEEPGKKYSSLYMHSDSGLGKTHLLHAVANKISELHPTKVICLTTARDFMNEMIYSFQNRVITEFRRKYSEKIDILIIDDIHELKGKEGTQDEFFHVFNELHNKKKQLIFTSDRTPKDITGIAERIKTRLQWGLVVDISKPNLETRIAILKHKANELDLFIPEDAINLIATCIKTNIRELEGTLIRLSCQANVMKLEIDMEMIREHLSISKDTANGKDSIELEDIAKAVSHRFGISPSALKSKARGKKVTQARHIAMYLSRKMTSSTQREIGQFFGNRDHTSVIHAISKVLQLLKNNPPLLQDIVAIEKKF